MNIKRKAAQIFEFGIEGKGVLIGVAIKRRGVGTMSGFTTMMRARVNGQETNPTSPAKFMEEHGYEWESQLIMSRFARPVGENKKDEIIYFYFENLKDYKR